jgi:restriction system protein
MAVPKYDELINPLLKALHALGGSASISELEEKVAADLKLTDKDLEVIHEGNRPKFSYNLAWARSYLKQFGLIENSARGVWALTSEGQKTKQVNKDEVKRKNRSESYALRKNAKKPEQPKTDINGDGRKWETEVLEAVKNIKPEAFERLCQRVLREAGFVQVEVTGRSGDGGIDGKGILKMGAILSFHVFFQCKRYKGSVSNAVIRDFRGAMDGRADKGIIITTGTFTREARLEALRDGATPLDLIDGSELVQMLKDFRLGISVKERVVQEVMVDEQWFLDF